MAKLGISLSQLSGSQIEKSGHDDYIQAHRVIASDYPVMNTFYDENNNPIRIEKYVGSKKLKFDLMLPSDVNSSLAGTYFLINDALDIREFYVYFVVDGVGVDPMVENRVGIRVDIAENDSAGIVATAVKFLLEGSIGIMFTILRQNAVLTFEAKAAGETVAPTDSNSGIAVSVSQEGENRWMQTINIEYDNTGDCPILINRKVINRDMFEKDICC